MLCTSTDIIFSQETWLTDFDTLCLTVISDEFYAKGIYSIDFSIHLLAGPPYRGLGILSRNILDEKCNTVDIYDTRLKNTDDEIKLPFANIYLPFDCADNTDDFMQYLSRVNYIF